MPLRCRLGLMSKSLPILERDDDAADADDHAVLARPPSARLRPPPKAEDVELDFDAPSSGLEPDDLVPVFRADLQVKPRGGTVEITDVAKEKSFSIYDFELTIARMLDGKRTVGEVVSGAARLGIPVTLDGFRKFLRQLHAYGFIAQQGAPPRRGALSQWEEKESWPPGVRELFQSGVRHLRNDRPKEASGFFEAILQIDPSNADAVELRSLAEAQLNRGDPEPTPEPADSMPTAEEPVADAPPRTSTLTSRILLGVAAACALVTAAGAWLTLSVSRDVMRAAAQPPPPAPVAPVQPVAPAPVVVPAPPTEAAVVSPEPPTIVVARAEAPTPPAPKPAPRTVADKAETQVSPVPDSVMEHYETGDLKGAIAEALALDDQGLARRLVELQSALQLADTAWKAHKAQATVNSLETARKLDRKLQGGWGHFGDRISKQLSDAWTAVGREQAAKGRTKQARAAFASALKLNSKNADAQTELAALTHSKVEAKKTSAPNSIDDAWDNDGN